MKKTLYRRQLLLIPLVIMMITACSKFKLLQNESLPPVTAGENLKSETIWQYVSDGNFHQNDLTKVGLYGQALKYAGLTDLLDSDGDYTIVLLNDDAMKLLFTKLGYANLAATPPLVMRNALLNLMTITRIHSFDLEIGETRGYPTLNADSIFYTRTSTSTDQYVFRVSKSASVTPTAIRNQNLEFKNGIAHVVVSLPVYDPLITAADNPSSAVTVSTDTLYVAKDAYTQGGSSANTSFAATTDLMSRSYSDINFERHALFQFPLRQPTFTGRIGSARFVTYLSSITGGKGGTVNLSESFYVDWNEATLTRNNAPAFGSIIGSFSVPATNNLNKYYSGDITPTVVNDLKASHTFINIDAFSDNDLMGFKPREYLSGKFKAYILLSSPPATILSLANNNTLKVSLAQGFGLKKLSLSDLQFNGTSSKNIFYNLTALPQNGLLLRRGVPMLLNAIFTQEEIEKSLIIYAYTGTSAGTDSFKVEVKDYNGGYYSPIITVPVQIQ